MLSTRLIEQTKEKELLKIVKLPEVLLLTGLSRTNVYDQMKAEIFPLAVKLGERSVGWYEIEIIEWLKTRPRTKE